MSRFAWFAAGAAALLAAKYLIFGLDAWNGTLHPGRSEDPNLRSRFGKPLLGVLSK